MRGIIEWGGLLVRADAVLVVDRRTLDTGEFYCGEVTIRDFPRMVQLRSQSEVESFVKAWKVGLEELCGEGNVGAVLEQVMG